MIIELVEVPDSSSLGERKPRASAIRARRQGLEFGGQEVRHALQLAGPFEVAGERQQAVAVLG